MPNGFTGSQESWNEADSVLSVIDTLASECVQDRGITITRNYHSWPSRSIDWVSQGLQRKVQVYLSSEIAGTYNVWLCASKETGGTVYWREEFVRQNVAWEVLSKEIRDVLIQALGVVESWTAGDLTPAHKV